MNGVHDVIKMNPGQEKLAQLPGLLQNVTAQ